MRQIILDTETTGLRVEDGHRVIEIGGLEMINRKLTGRKFHEYLNPQREIDAGALAVHGISNEFLKDKPLFKDVVSSFLAFIEDAELIIHNASFDLGFLNNELVITKACGKTLTDLCRVTDTLQLARKLHVGQRNSLDALCKRYGIDNSKREFHGALLDAYLLSQVYLTMTGGQGNFFDALTQDPHTPHQLSQQSIKSSMPLVDQPIHKIMIKPEDEAAHRQYLNLLREKGKCVWEE